MKIMIIGSMAFTNEMLELKDELHKLGHEVDIPFGAEPHMNDKTFVDNLDGNLEFCIENDIMRRNFDFIKEHDAVLVINHRRNEVDGYIGISALMELGVAHFLRKKIFLLNPIPDYKSHRWAHEVEIMQPIILNGDLGKIK